jgi:hypothetical protein
VLIFLGIVLVPTTLYLYWAHPAWSWLYLVDPGSVPGLAVVPVLVVMGGIFVGGWYLGARLIRIDRGPVAAYVAAGGMALFLLLILLLRARLGSYGTYAEFRASTAAPLLERKLGWVLMALALGFGVSAGYTALELVRDSRRVRAR